MSIHYFINMVDYLTVGDSVKNTFFTLRIFVFSGFAVNFADKPDKNMDKKGSLLFTKTW